MGSSGGPNWEGLLKWSLAHSDGTRPNRCLSEEDRKWFMEAMQAQTIDVVKRMKEISLVMQAPKHVLEEQGVTPADIEDLLDELQEHVESIDMANDLHAVGGLVPLLGYLQNSNANIRAKAAEVVSTMVQNNPKCQKLVMEANGFECLFSLFTSDPSLSVRTKALGAVSSLIRDNQPGVTAFRQAKNGYTALKEGLASESARFQRKALSLISYLLRENIADCNIVSELGFPSLMVQLVSSKDIDVREGALEGLVELARWKTEVVKKDEKLKQVLRARIDDVKADREEMELVDSLWNVCYKEPSPLREKGLLVFPGEDVPPPDVASKHFEPALRALVPKPS